MRRSRQQPGFAELALGGDVPHLGSVHFAINLPGNSLGHTGGLILPLGDVRQVASIHSFHFGSSLMVMSDLGKSAHLLGFLLALFSGLLDTLTLTLPTRKSYADPSISKLSQQCTLKANYSGGKNSFKDQKRGSLSIGLKFSSADQKDGKSDQV